MGEWGCGECRLGSREIYAWCVHAFTNESNDIISVWIVNVFSDQASFPSLPPLSLARSSFNSFAHHAAYVTCNVFMHTLFPIPNLLNFHIYIYGKLNIKNQWCIPNLEMRAWYVLYILYLFLLSLLLLKGI